MGELVILIIVFIAALWFTDGSFITSAIVTAIVLGMLGVDLDEEKIKEQTAELTELIDETIEERTGQPEEEIVVQAEPEEVVPIFDLRTKKPKEVVEVPNEQKEVQVDNFANVPDGRITDKLRNVKPVTVKSVGGNLRGCHSAGKCFLAEIRKHEGRVYACDLNSINCYPVR